MAQLGTVHTRDGGFEKALGVDAGSTTMARTFRYTEAEEAGRILTDAEVTVVLQGPRFQAWKNFVDHGARRDRHSDRLRQASAVG